MDFANWYKNADMPKQDKNGKWFDLEDGIYFNEFPKKIKSVKSDQRKAAEKELKNKKNELSKKIADFKSRTWSEIPQEEKKQFYSWIKDLEILEKTKISFELIKVVGNTFPIKDFIKQRGGKWNAEEKAWYVPSDFYQDILNAIPA